MEEDNNDIINYYTHSLAKNAVDMMQKNKDEVMGDNRIAFRLQQNGGVSYASKWKNTLTV